ncbi:MAG: cytochrome c [Cyclobacteriaceae bacterium]|jgi:mono/diheme cytochrome c family protein|nr:cytochrome c [Cyclobacteriaceae bacterium]
MPTKLAVGVLWLLAACTGRDPKFQQYYVQGEKLYQQHCSNCHQKKGEGLGRLYPPLAQSDYMQQNFDQVICLMRYGIQGPLTVNGITYNQAMPGVPQLTELELAELATYIYNTGEHARGRVTLEEVARSLKACP